MGALWQDVGAGYCTEPQCPCSYTYQLDFKSRRLHSVFQTAPPVEDQMFKHTGTFHIQTLQTTGPRRGLVGWAQWPEASKRRALDFVLSFQGKLSSLAAGEWRWCLGSNCQARNSTWRWGDSLPRPPPLYLLLCCEALQSKMTDVNPAVVRTMN